LQSPLAERDSGRPGGGSADLGRRTLVVATHVYATGPGHALAEYGASRAGRMVFMGHPFGYAPDVRPLLERWQEGVLVTRRHVRWRRGTPELVSWARDVALTLVWGFRTPGTADVFVGCDSLLAATGLMLRRLGKARIVVLWTIDYVPERFGNPVLNRIYHAFDKLCVRRCDETWNLSPVMEEARAARGVHGRQRVVPMGASSTAAVGRRNSRQLVFVGHLLEKQGVQLVLEALPTILRRLPEARLLVIGDGPYRPALERQAERLGVSQAVEFAGFVEDHHEIERRLAESGVGLAPYDPAQAGFSAYADPGKIKYYLAAGLPVVTTEVAHISSELADRRCGVVIPYTAVALADAVFEIAADEHGFSSRASELGAQFSWTRILDGALGAVLERVPLPT